MPISEIKSVVFSAALLQENGTPLSSFNTSIQFFDLRSNAWLLLASGVLSDTKGKILYTLQFNTSVKENLRFFELLQSGLAPNVRIITTDSLMAAVKQLIAQNGKPSYADRTSSFTIAFGSCFRLSPEVRTRVVADKLDQSQLAFVPFLDVAVYEANNKLRKELEQKTAQLNKLNDAFVSLQQKHELLQREYAGLQEQHRLLDGQNKELTTANASLRKELEHLISQNNQQKAELLRLIKLLEESQLCQQKLEATAKELDQLKLVLQKVMDHNERLDQALKEQGSELAKINVEYSVLEQVIVEQNDQIKESAEQLHTANQQVQELERHNNLLLAQIKELNQKIAQQATERTAYEPIAQPVNKVYSSLIDEFQKAAELTKDSNFKLASVSLNLKTFLEYDDAGLRVQLVDAHKLKDSNGAGLSSINIDIKDANTTKSGSGPMMPDMMGLTESAARRIADSLGLRMKSVYQYVNAKVPNGQCFKQIPAQGTVLSHQDIITLIFAKENN